MTRAPPAADVGGTALAALSNTLWDEVRRRAPAAPRWFETVVVRTLTNPEATADTFFILADALRDAADAAQLDGVLTLARHLRALAELPEQMAAHRNPVKDP